MAVTEQELQDFHEFAMHELARGRDDSVSDLARLWEESRAHRESLAALRESHADAEAGRVIPDHEVFSDLRRTLGISE